jgi:two-component system sensor histidine kinase CiaH
MQRFFKSPTARLAGTYLLIIMAMSIGFSFVFYHTSSRELGRQLPPTSYFNNQTNSEVADGQASSGFRSGQSNQVTPPQLDKFLQQRISEGRKALLERQIYLNIGALLIGSALSYILARRSLEPIEEAMEAQSQFVSDASHELRTPLTAIQTSNEVFLRRPKVTVAEARQLIEQNTTDIKRLKELSDGLLTLSQHAQNLDALLVPIHIQDIVSEALNQVVAQATEKDITLHDELKDLTVLADRTTLTQAMVILLDNAVKYSDKKGNIYLASHVRAKFAYISVRDDGIGIRASDIPHLFRRFYRADNARTSGERAGYGLGLPIAKQILENHQGDILVDSTPDKGSTFTLKLPLA